MTDKTTETFSWSARPSIRHHAFFGAAATGISYYLMGKAGPGFQSLINATAESIYWSDELINGVYYGLLAAAWIPLGIVGLSLARALSTKYEVVEGRFLYHSGLLFRRHDQIALQRVRDFRVFRPLWQRVLGLGKVHMVSRDETYPELTIGPFSDPLGVEKLLHAAVLEQQNKVGYKEFETT